MIEHSEQLVELFKALHVAQKGLAGVKRDSQNPHFRNRYASLEAVIETAKGPLSESGLAFTQAPGRIVDGAVEITTMLMHTSGQWLRSTLHVPLSKTDPQGCGSAITYGCRYALMATLGLPPIDDDGEAAVGRGAAMRGRTGGEEGEKKGEKHQNNAVTPMPEPEAALSYVKMAKAAIATARTQAELNSWWAAEKPNRVKYRLDASKGPGLDLSIAYGERKEELKELANA